MISIWPRVAVARTSGSFPGSPIPGISRTIAKGRREFHRKINAFNDSNGRPVTHLGPGTSGSVRGAILRSRQPPSARSSVMRRKRNALGADVTWYFFRYCRPAHHESSATSIALPSRFGSAAVLKLGHVEFREGIAENLPVEDEWADVVISNGVINLCADKRATFSEIFRVFFRVSVGARTLRSIAGVGSRSRQPARSRCSLQPVANLRPRRHRQLPKRYLSCSPRTRYSK